MSDPLHEIKTVYKIRRKSDGLYSTGGMQPSFSKKGKVWNNRGALTNHFNLVTYRRVYDNCEVVTVEVTAIEADTEDASAWTAAIANKKLKLEQDRKAAREAAREQQELAELRRLKAKYGDPK